ncbi:formimidoylglutamate deiminase [Chondromyces apiculatus]|uniref:Formiminoglutamic iminohydrolase n=1 Tax=Chondromyces apiculatus DSM 436 TaxID=1192034 RepID=A0A017SVU5_9BACT|nr:formimidoylglutamate deiminase [Chondromyces apiculatus]EYF00740.1 Formiminoglutamic iminohydrolase [Chondromyces apiculatus DSM 436]
MIRVTSRSVELPALASAHSHAFQRGMRGEAQRPGDAGQDDFWSWRTAMYGLADALTPESIYEISLVAYRELREAGVRTVGEFHYVHHQQGGVPYAERTVLADAVIQAARAAGIRVALLRVIYARAGAGKAPEGAQRRFCDATLEAAIADVEALRARYAGAEDVVIGVAPHSVRAVPPDWLPEIAAYAARHALPLHMHVAEQPAEIAACLAETGRRPVELLADRGVLSERFVAVHATHLAPHEPALLGQANAFACLCPTTERDLGDGLPDVTALRAAGVRLCTGVDSHVMSDPFEDMRAVELGERLRTGRRVTLRRSGGGGVAEGGGGGEEGRLDEGRSPAEELWRVGSQLGAEACGFADAGGTISIDRAAPQLALVREERLLDAIVFSGGPALVMGYCVP